MKRLTKDEFNGLYDGRRHAALGDDGATIGIKTETDEAPVIDYLGSFENYPTPRQYRGVQYFRLDRTDGRWEKIDENGRVKFAGLGTPDMGRHEYRYFFTENADNIKQAKQDYARMKDCGTGWEMLGMTVRLSLHGAAFYASLWGIESDSGPEYFQEVAYELYCDCYAQLDRFVQKVTA